MKSRTALAVLIWTTSLGAQANAPRFGSGPWIFLETGAGVAAAPSSGFAGTLVGPRQMGLDNGRSATFRVQHEPCLPPENCGATDCGCHDVDRYRLSIVAGTGAVVATTLLWAAYGTFDIVPVDLVDGPGDELLIVRNVGRSAPPNGLELKILKTDGVHLRELLAAHQIAGNFSGTPMVCGQWRSRVVIDMAAPKPRELRTQNDVIIPSPCTLDEPAVADQIRRREATLVLRGGRYGAR